MRYGINQGYNPVQLPNMKKLTTLITSKSLFAQRRNMQSINFVFYYFAVRISTRTSRGDNCMRIHKVLKCTSPPLVKGLKHLDWASREPARGASERPMQFLSLLISFRLWIFIINFSSIDWSVLSFTSSPWSRGCGKILLRSTRVHKFHKFAAIFPVFLSRGLPSRNVYWKIDRPTIEGKDTAGWSWSWSCTNVRHGERRRTGLTFAIP